MKAFDITPIVRNFYEMILKDNDKSDLEAYILMVLPVGLAQVAIYSHVSRSTLSTITTALAILFGFTFSSLLSAAKYSAKDDPLEKVVVQETRIGTSYALLVNLLTLVLVVGSSIYVVDFTQLSYPAATALSAVIYYMIFHYFLTMIYMMRYFYLLAIGGAFEDNSTNKSSTEDDTGKETQRVEY